MTIDPSTSHSAESLRIGTPPLGPPPEVLRHLPAELADKTQRLWQRVTAFAQPIVAFSGGVDSSLLAAVLALTHARRVLLVTADSPSLSQRQRDIAARVARELDLPHRWLATQEATDPLYQRNQRDRCYYCKSHLYAALSAVAEEFPEATVFSGTNLDDLGDFRPGLRAAAEQNVRAPLAETGFTKADVRGLAQALNLSVHDLPAAPCLASRLAYGVAVTPERLRRVERAEQWLWEAGFSDVRVRVLPGELARIEVPHAEVLRLASWLRPDSDDRARPDFGALGFNDVEIAAQGLVSGNLNSLPDAVDASKISQSLPRLPIL